MSPGAGSGRPGALDDAIGSPRQLRSWLATIAVIALPLLAGVGFWTWSATHPPLPGLRGCDLVRSSPDRLDCLTGEVRGLVSARGVGGAFTVIDRAAARYPRLAAQCHLASHPAGEARGRTAGKLGRSPAAADGGSSCRDGFDHGYQIGFVEGAGGTRAAARTLVSLCGSLGARGAARSCFHSTGHVAARRHERDADAVADCTALDVEGASSAAVRGVATDMRFECLYGLFMERTLQHLAQGGPVPAGELDNCVALGGLAADACYAFLPARLSQLGDLDRVVRACAAAPRSTARRLCTEAARKQGDAKIEG